MAQVAGSVTVADDETVTGSDYARALYDADLASMVAASMLPVVPTVGSTAHPYSSSRPANAEDAANVKGGRLVLLRESARRATAHASAYVTYFAAHAKARINSDATGDGLQNGTTHPSSDKLLPLE